MNTKIQSDRAKAAVGMLTGGAGKLVPGYGQAIGAAGTAVGAAIDYGTKSSRQQVTFNRAEALAERDMDKSITRGFEGYEDYAATRKLAGDLSAVGRGKKGATAPSVESPEQIARLTAYNRGEIEHQKLYDKHYKQMEKQQAAAKKAESLAAAAAEKEALKDAEARKPKQEGAGVLSRMKNFFRRSS